MLAMCVVRRAPGPRLWLFVAVTTALGVPPILHAAVNFNKRRRVWGGREGWRREGGTGRLEGGLFERGVPRSGVCSGAAEGGLRL